MSEIKIRKRKLSFGWYPDNSEKIKSFIINNIDNKNSISRNSIAAIVPHAGWYYSGKLAVRSIYRLYPYPDTIIIIGGHLKSGAPLYYFPEDKFETPIGDFNMDKLFLPGLREEFEIKQDYTNDNTVEIIVPILKYFFPKSKLLCLRIGAGKEAVKLGTVIYNISRKLNQNINVIGSTDLTHYGRNYSFSPHGTGIKALNWAKEINDKEIINKMLNMDYDGILESANNNSSACSSGAASAVVRFADHFEKKSGHLVGYSNSYDISPADSFVGYAGITF